MIHRLLTCQLTLIDGHIYYGNNVIKLRYDLLNKQIHSEFLTYPESTFFNMYNMIFELKCNWHLLTGAPLRSQKYHRLGYLIQDKKYSQH